MTNDFWLYTCVFVKTNPHVPAQLEPKTFSPKAKKPNKTS
uniref:Uncharacterized protein n=1 Tax=viral metagenome TaxID=1070528 RepID=A0A6C0HUF5_9ZZZZ